MGRPPRIIPPLEGNFEDLARMLVQPLVKKEPEKKQAKKAEKKLDKKKKPD
jgi:hypothetical protein